MSTAAKQKAKAAGIRLDDDSADTPSEPVVPRTAPGQLIGLQGRVHSQQAEIDKLKRALEQRAPGKLPLDKLHEIPGRRRRLTAAEYAELKANLSAYPLAQPITVRERHDGEYDIVAGHNRASAYRELGRTEIDGIVLDIDASMVEYAAFFSNLLSPTLSDFEKFWGFKSLQDSTGITKEDLAKAAGISDSHVGRIMKFDLLPEDCKRLLSTRPERLGSNAAEQMAKAITEGRVEKVKAAIERLMSDDTFTQAQAVAATKADRVSRERNEPLIVKQGSRKVCQISARNGVVGVSFSGKAAEEADQWAERIHAFIESELEKQ
jgi:ParB family transcriptional regulator, chromosome partitioning protein